MFSLPREGAALACVGAALACGGECVSFWARGVSMSLSWRLPSSSVGTEQGKPYTLAPTHPYRRYTEPSVLVRTQASCDFRT